jgi:hypothetical protein
MASLAASFLPALSHCPCEFHWKEGNETSEEENIRKQNERRRKYRKTHVKNDQMLGLRFVFRVYSNNNKTTI